MNGKCEWFKSYDICYGFKFFPNKIEWLPLLVTKNSTLPTILIETKIFVDPFLTDLTHNFKKYVM